MCAATGSELHLIHPLGFRVDEKSVRRAGLDYWHLVHVVEHTSFAEFTNSLPAQARLLFFSGKAARSFLEIAYSPGDYLVFGKESSGLSEEILEKYKEHLVGIPTLGPVRSLNLANAAALGVFEALRQTGKLAECSLQGVASGSGATSA
jgi:tRNA (cytidine/uridine-2'-O-)-methyltransferase